MSDDVLAAKDARIAVLESLAKELADAKSELAAKDARIAVLDMEACSLNRVVQARDREVCSLNRMVQARDREVCSLNRVVQARDRVVKIWYGLCQELEEEVEAMMDEHYPNRRR